jgi:hypothetical protein
MGDIPVGDRHPWVPGEEVNTEWGVIVHVPSGKGRATLHPVNLALGWELAQLSATVREWRKRKDIIGKPVTLIEDFHATAAGAESVQELTAAYTRAVEAGAWNDVLKAAFGRRKREILAAGVPA